MSVETRLQLAVAAASRGDLDTARTEAEAALRLRANDPAALQILGVVHCQMGDLRKGAQFFRKALRQSPGSPDLRFNLARALFDAGDLTEAERVSRPAAAGSTPPEMLRLHADILKAQGRLFEAFSVYAALVQAQPGDFEAWNNLGNAKHEAGDFEGAVEALERARGLNADSALVHTNLGRVFASMARHEDSCRSFAEAARRTPGEAGPLLEYGQSLLRLDHLSDALVALSAAARADSRNPRTFVEIGQAFAGLEDMRQAEQAYRVAVQVDPAYAPALLNLGILLEQSNRAEELDALLQAAGERSVTGSEIDYLRALSLHRQGKTERALSLARQSFAEAIDPAVRAHFIALLEDRLGHVDAAFEAAVEMNQALAATPLGQSADAAGYRLEIERLKAVTDAGWYQSWTPVDVPTDPPSPVFILGFPRSGTTLLDTMLMGHPATHVLEELPLLARVSDALGDVAQLARLDPADVAALRAGYFQELARLAPAAAGKVVIDKNPLAMLRAPLIHRIFPDAKIMFVLRHPADVVLSCFMQNFKPTPSMASFLELGAASQLYNLIMAYWEQCRRILPLAIHTIRYEAMVEDAEREIRGALDFLGLPWVDGILDHQRTAAKRGYIRTPSYAQVTEKLYDRAAGRWQRYRPYMEPVLPLLEPWAQRYGYSMD